MDYLRSCYTVPMVFRVGDIPLSVKWRWALPVAKVFPGPHNFASANWDDGFCPAGRVGEQAGPRVWSNGKENPLVSGQVLGASPVRWFQEGLLPGEAGSLFTTDCRDARCSEANPSYWNGSLVPDRIKVVLHQSGSPFCGINGLTYVLGRIPGRSSWYREKLRPNLCYYWHQFELERTGTLVNNWILKIDLRSLVSFVTPNIGVLVAFTTTPFGMQFFFPSFQTSYWTSPVTAQLTGV
jgi:hypothetical protein